MAAAGLRCLAGNGIHAASTSNLIPRRFIPLLNGAALAGCAVFSYPGRDYVLVGLMLFLPLLDRHWSLPALPARRGDLAVMSVLVLVIIALLAWQPQHLSYALSALLLAALPEEWFFRAYFMTRIAHGWRANLVASLLFSVLHGLNREWTTAAMVFVPSLFYGWLYQRSQNFPLLVLVHALSNIIYLLFLSSLVTIWLDFISRNV